MATKIARIDKKKTTREREQMAEEASACPLAAGRGSAGRKFKVEDGCRSGPIEAFPQHKPNLGKNMRNQGTN